MDAMEAVLRLLNDGVIDVRPDGTIWKLRNLNAMPLKEPRRLETTVKGGYLAIRVSQGGRSHMLAAHRVVWTVLRGPIPTGMDINHIDGCKKNNAPENLELATRSENHLHAYRTGLRGATKSIPPRILESIADRAKALRAEGLSFSKIAEALGVSQTTAFRATRVK